MTAPPATLPKAVILFGASGFIGRNIVDTLTGQTRLIGVTGSGSPVPGCDQVVTPSALPALDTLPADTAIIHVAAFRYFASRFGRQQAEILGANTALTQTVYEFALSRGIKEVRVASSSAVYPASWAVLDDTRPIDLNAWPHDGEAAYAWSKRWGEITADLWHRRAGINTISFRLTNPYGPHDTLDESEGHVATAFIIRALGPGQDFEVRGDPDAERDFVFAGDVANAFVASLSLRGVNAAMNCARGETIRIVDLAGSAMRAAGRVRPLRTNPPPPGGNPGVKIRRATGDRIRAEIPGLGAFRDIDAGMHATIEWYRNALR